mgnify:CR=1 FL=1
MGEKADIRNRKHIVGMLRKRLKSWLKESKMSKRWQARIMEACVESSLMYDCQEKWQKREIKRLQSWMDRCNIYFWINGNGSCSYR